MTHLLKRVVRGFQAYRFDFEFDSIHWCQVNFYGLGYERVVGFQRRWQWGWVQNITGSGKTLHMGPIFAYQWR